MFIMMNAARLSVGLEGYAVASVLSAGGGICAHADQGKPPVAQGRWPVPDHLTADITDAA